MYALIDCREGLVSQFQTILPRLMFTIPFGLAALAFVLSPIGPAFAQQQPHHDHAALGVFLNQGGDGVSVAEVIPGSPAERAGIVAGDEIRSVEMIAF